MTDLLDVTVPQSVACAYLSHDLARGDGLLARLAPYGERAQVLGTSCLLKPVEAAGIARMVTALRARARDAATQTLSDRAVMRMFEGAAVLRFVSAIDEHMADTGPHDGSIIIAG